MGGVALPLHFTCLALAPKLPRSILPQHVPCHCPFTCPALAPIHRVVPRPCPHIPTCAPPLTQHVICPSVSILPPPYHCPTCALLLCVHAEPRPCPHMGPNFASSLAPPLDHTCSTLALLHVPQFLPHVLCHCLHICSTLASSRVLPLSYTCLALACPPHVP